MKRMMMSEHVRSVPSEFDDQLRRAVITCGRGLGLSRQVTRKAEKQISLFRFGSPTHV